MTSSEILNLKYPTNVMFLFGINHPNRDQIKGFNYLLNSLGLTEANKKYLIYRFQYRMTLQKIADHYNVSRQAVDCSIKNTLAKMKKSPNFGYAEYGFNKFSNKKVEDEKKSQKREKDNHRKNIQRKIERAGTSDLRKVMVKDVRTKGYLLDNKVILKKAYEMNIFDYTNEYSNYLPNALRLCNSTLFNRDENCEFMTFAEILNLVKENPYWYSKVSGMGYRKAKELYAMMFDMQFLTKFEYDYLCSFTRPPTPAYTKKKENRKKAS